MKHLTEEELIGQAYGEGVDGAAEHLAACGECAAAYTDLKNDISDLHRLDLHQMEPPSRDASYGRQVWEAIADSLPAYSPRPRRWMGMSLIQGLSYAALCALLLATAFYAGRKWENWRRPRITAQINKPAQPKQPIVVVVLSDHLDRSERLLVELKHVDANNADMMPPLRDEARSLLAANRICRRNAQTTGDPALEGALDHLDHLLGELANHPGGLNAAAITRLKDEMNDDGLLFEVRVLRSRVPDRNTGIRNHSSGGTV
jgi:hypothetical protein